MDDDSLTNLLRRADAAAATPVVRDDVVGAARHRSHRRRVARRVSVACAAVCGVLVATVVATLNQDNPSKPSVATISEIAREAPAVDVAAIRAELASLERECEAREAAVDRVMDAARQRAGRTRDPIDELRWQREQAALVLVRQGDRLANDLSLPQPAAVAYRSASVTFPETRWGAVARARLADQ